MFRGCRAVEKKVRRQRILYCNEFLTSTNVSILCFSAVFQAFPCLYSGFGYWRFRCFRSAFKHVVFISIGLLIAVFIVFQRYPVQLLTPKKRGFLEMKACSILINISWHIVNKSLFISPAGLLEHKKRWLIASSTASTYSRG